MNSEVDKAAHVAGLIQEAYAAGLEGIGWATWLGSARCAEAYNGIGPEFLPAAVRDRITRYLALFEPAALIHDARTDASDGSRERFLAANDEFRRNCLKLANRAYSWYDWRRYRARAAAQVLFDFVSADSFGWKAWQDAARKNALDS